MAKSNNVVKAKEAKKTVQKSGPAVRVLYPQEGETLTQPSYTFHIGTIPEASRVEVSIDQSDWKPCRESLGLWWYDWANYSAGEHVVEARSCDRGEVWVTSAPRRFAVT